MARHRHYSFETGFWYGGYLSRQAFCFSLIMKCSCLPLRQKSSCERIVGINEIKRNLAIEGHIPFRLQLLYCSLLLRGRQEEAGRVLGGLCVCYLLPAGSVSVIPRSTEDKLHGYRFSGKTSFLLTFLRQSAG